MSCQLMLASRGLGEVIQAILGSRKLLGIIVAEGHMLLL